MEENGKFNTVLINKHKENANNKFTPDIISLHRITRRHAAKLFIIYIKQTMKWTKYMEMDIGFKTKPNQMKRWKCMLDQTTHWRSSRNWNGILCDFI